MEFAVVSRTLLHFCFQLKPEMKRGYPRSRASRIFDSTNAVCVEKEMQFPHSSAQKRNKPPVSIIHILELSKNTPNL